MILITTSRKPGRRTRSFCKDLQRALPHSKYVNRGKGSVWDIVELAFRQGFLRVLIVGETKGNPSLIRSIEVFREPRWGLQIYISGVKLCREVGCEKSEGESLVVEGDLYHEPLRKVFQYPIEGEAVVLREIKGRASFVYEGANVGPLFTVRGWDEIPAKLKAQSTLKK